MEPIRIFACQYDELDPPVSIPTLQETIKLLQQRLVEKEKEVHRLTDELSVWKQKYVTALNR